MVPDAKCMSPICGVLHHTIMFAQELTVDKITFDGKIIRLHLKTFVIIKVSVYSMFMF